MNIKQTVVIEGKSRYNFNNDQGENVKGAKLFVTDGQILSQENKVGKFTTEFKVPYEVFEQCHQVPGEYELSLTMKVGSEGQFSVNGVRYIGKNAEVATK